MVNVSRQNLCAIKTGILYLSFLSLGLCIAAPGPTLLDL
ncbi:hypothetical protein X975_22659, partial [Stegodyphus mimosarum]